jgi:membrane-associated phospholipid phosphatase
MKKNILCILLVTLIYSSIHAEIEPIDNIPPITLVFYNIGWNALHSVTYNYGLNFISAGLGTWVLIETGVDWKWNRLSYNNSWMSDIGSSANYIGYAVPVVTPLALYFTGLFSKDEKLQIAGMALTQTLILTLAIQTPLKIITGRTWPGIVDGWDSSLSKRSYRTDDYSREFNWFNLDSIGGWPSGHTANAFAAAATLAQIYSDKPLLKIGMFCYASLVGLGMSVYDHWSSDVIAGALIGYAIGTTVGKSFSQLLKKNESEDNFSFYFTQSMIGVIIRI